MRKSISSPYVLIDFFQNKSVEIQKSYQRFPQFTEDLFNLERFFS